MDEEFTCCSRLFTNPGFNNEEANQHIAEVMRGDLTITVNGIGNIAISQERMLFFGTDGRVDEVYVDEGGEAAVEIGRGIMPA